MKNFKTSVILFFCFKVIKANTLMSSSVDNYFRDIIRYNIKETQKKATLVSKMKTLNKIHVKCILSLFSFIKFVYHVCYTVIKFVQRLSPPHTQLNIVTHFLFVSIWSRL